MQAKSGLIDRASAVAKSTSHSARRDPLEWWLFRWGRLSEEQPNLSPIGFAGRGIEETHRRPMTLFGAPAAGRRAAMELGDAVIFGGRRFYVRGLDPAGVAPRYLYLEDAATGKGVQVSLREEWLKTHEGDGVLRLVDDSGHQD